MKKLIKKLFFLRDDRSLERIKSELDTERTFLTIIAIILIPLIIGTVELTLSEKVDGKTIPKANLFGQEIDWTIRQSYYVAIGILLVIFLYIFIRHIVNTVKMR